MGRIAMQIDSPSPTPRLAKSKTILRDGLVFLVLTLISLALYGITFFLFRSFESRREVLAVYWADRGREELTQNQPKQATVSLRNALSYAPGNLAYQLLLAQALGDSGQNDQAINYFLNLRESQPGDGFINLELARLARAKKQSEQAISYYHSSLLGDWQGEGPLRRRAIRLELVDYLTALNRPDAARAELLIATNNALTNGNNNYIFGTKFEAIGDFPNALNAYKKAVIDNPRDPLVLDAAARISFQSGDYKSAATFYEDELKINRKDEGRRQQLQYLAAQSQRLAELSFSHELTGQERAEHLLLVIPIAFRRFTACSAELGKAGQQKSAAMEDLKARWKIAKNINRATLPQDPIEQNTLANLIDDTETITAQSCGKPIGDNALLLRLATERDDRR